MLSPILGPTGQPVRRVGRPSSASQVDRTREYTASGGASRFGNINSGSDLERLHGSVEDMDLRLGWDAKEQMDRHPVCSSALDTLVLGALPRAIEVVIAKESSYESEEDKKVAVEMAAFATRALSYLAQSQRDFRGILFSLGRTSLKIGHNKAEIVRRKIRVGEDAGKSVIDRIKAKSRHNSCFVVDRAMNVVGIAAYTGDYGGGYQSPYTSLGLAGYGSWSQLAGSGWEVLPRDKWLVMTNRPGDDDSPLGTSAYRRAYEDFRCDRDVLPYYLKCLDTTAMPMMTVALPSLEDAGGQSFYPVDEFGEPDLTAEKIPMASVVYNAAEIARQGGIAVFPHGTQTDLHYNAASGDPFATAMGVFSGRMTQAILLQQLMTGTARHMARSAGEVHQDVFDLAARSVRFDLLAAVNRDIMAPLIHDNFPERHWHLMPSFSAGDVELNDFAAWSAAIADLAGSGLIYPSQIPFMHTVLGLPQADMNEVYEQIDVDKALNESLMQPEEKVNPDGSVTTGPSQMKLQLEGEYSKRESRNIGKKRAGRVGAMMN